MTAKVSVDGSVTWQKSLQVTKSGTQRIITSNGLPSHRTGIYPVQSTDDAYPWDANPNSISAQTVSYGLTADPVAGTPQCADGSVGIALAGGMIFNGFDAQQKDAAANEIQDECGGHPNRSGTYHYHSLPLCHADTSSGHSSLYGYAFDGFGIYGVRGDDGRTLANNDLDECHGHTHQIDWDGVSKVMYHYHITYEFPYTVSCYRAAPVRIR